MWDTPEPDCPACAERTQQEFRPFAITGGASARAHAIAEEIVTTDYHGADFQREPRQEGTPSVRYIDQTKGVAPSAWQKESANAAIAQGRAVAGIRRGSEGGKTTG